MNSFNDNDRNRKDGDIESLESILNRYMFGDDYEIESASAMRRETSSSSQRFEKEPYREVGGDSESVAKRIGLATMEKKESPRDDLKNSHSKDKPIPKPGAAMLFFGVILPVLAMLFESQTHVMARGFLDPFPTLNHYLLFSIIPLSCFLTWLAARTNIISVYAITALGAGMALGVSILYSLMLLPMTPLLFLMFPLGLLGLAPLFSIFQTLKAGNTICAIASRHDTFFDPHQFKHLGHLIILVMVVAVELPSTMTRIHLADASGTDKVKAQQSLEWLRSWGSKDVLLRACYERSGRATDLIGSIYEHQHPVSVNKARNVYYKVTGIPFNAVPIPASFRGTIQHNGLIKDPARLNAGAVDEFDLDPDIAGEMVQGVARGLSVTDSKIEGKVDANACVAAFDWTFNFANISKVPREARAKILLPPNAVVTRATMWIDGIEKEAKITGRSRARAIYRRAVVTHKRDPLLVSMQGKDTVLVQCYPVLKGSDTKVRLHIAAPLENLQQEAVLSLPMFAERNFTFSHPHKLVLESKTRIIDNNKTGLKLDESLDNDLLARAKANLTYDREQSKLFVEFEKPFLGKVTSPIETSVNLVTPTKLTIVIDKSKSMEPYIGSIKEALKNIPKAVDVYIIEVGDSGYSMLTKNTGEPIQPAELYLESDPKVATIKLNDAIKLLDRTRCDGGRVNSNTIARLLLNNSRTAGSAYGDILWIHGAQPVAGARDIQFVERYSKYMPTKLYDLQIASGPNALFDKSSMVKNFIRVRRSGDLKTDLNNLFRSWKESKERTPDEVNTYNTTKTMPEFEKLVAYREVLDKYYLGDIYGASNLAVENHIITPVSSAVVTDDNIIEKYERKKHVSVKPADKKEFPTKEIVTNLPLMVLSPYGCSQKTAGIRSSQEAKKSKNPVNKVFEKVTTQLNSLSDAAGSADFKNARSGAYLDARKRGDLEAKMAIAPKATEPGEYYRAGEGKELSFKQDMNAPLMAKKARQSTRFYRSRVAPSSMPEEESRVKSEIGDGRFNNESVQGKSLSLGGSPLTKMKEKGLIGGQARQEPARQLVAGAKDQLAASDEADDRDDADNKSPVVAQAMDFESGELELITEGETQAAVNPKAEVVPEPETIFMLLLAMMVLIGGLFVIQKQKSLSETK